MKLLGCVCVRRGLSFIVRFPTLGWEILVDLGVEPTKGVVWCGKRPHWVLMP